MDTSTMKPAGKKQTPANPEKAIKNGNIAKGAALAKVCIAYAEKRMQAEEKEQGKLQMIVKSIQELPREGHAEFRAELTAQLDMLKALRDSVGVDKNATVGYSFNSFMVLVTNWKTISKAVEMGYSAMNDDKTQKSWGMVLSESVAMKNGTTAQSGEIPAVQKGVGRPKTPLITLAKNAAAKLDNEQFKKFCAWAESELVTRNAQESSKPRAIKAVAALV